MARPIVPFNHRTIVMVRGYVFEIGNPEMGMDNRSREREREREYNRRFLEKPIVPFFSRFFNVESMAQ